jgi:glycosyltransferase involved in cell wall biosynthesis
MSEIPNLSVSSNISILHVGNFLSSSGRNRALVEDLADRLELAGWHIYRTSTFVSRPIRLASMAATIWLKRHQFSVGHIAVFSGPAFFWAEVASWMMRTVRRPFVLSLHGGKLPVFGEHWPNRTRRLLGAAAAVVTPSRYLFEEMRVYRADLAVLPNPIDLSRYAFSLRNQAQPKLVWMRAFHEVYNPLLAPKVLALLTSDLPAARLTMIGPSKGDTVLGVVRLATELGVAGRMTMPGLIPKGEISVWLNKSDVFLNTTNADNTPVSLLEAMACGLCIVSTNVGGIPYLLEDGVDALLVPPDDPEAMAAAVRRILAQPALAERLSRNARKKVGSFDWSLILPQWEELFLNVGARPNGRR